MNSVPNGDAAPPVPPAGYQPSPAAKAGRVVLFAVVLPVVMVVTGLTVLSGLEAVVGSARGGAGASATPAAQQRPAPGPTGGGPSSSAARVPLAPCPASSHASARAGAKDRLPALTLPCLGPGPAVRMAAAHQAPMVVNLWASWCDPCRREMPRLRESAARLGSRAVFLGVDSKDNPSDAWDFLAEARVRYAQVVDPDGKLLAGLRLPGIPVTYVLGPAGRIVYRHIGEMRPSDITALETAVLAAG